MYRLALFLRKWPLLTCFLLVMAAIALWPGEQANVDPRDKVDYGIFKGEMKESAKVEDANSAFIPNKLATLDEREYKIYARIFYKALAEGKQDEIRSWTTRSAFGRVQVGESFTNNDAQTCRMFTERYTVQKQTQTLSGKACQQKKGTWCKLRGDSVPTCKLNDQGGLGMFMEDAKIDIHNFETGKERFMHRLRNMF